jgi:hypothetical protein
MIKHSAQSIADKLLKKHKLKQSMVLDKVSPPVEAVKGWSAEDKRFFMSIGISEEYLVGEERISTTGRKTWR